MSSNYLGNCSFSPCIVVQGIEMVQMAFYWSFVLYKWLFVDCLYCNKSYLGCLSCYFICDASFPYDDSIYFIMIAIQFYIKSHFWFSNILGMADGTFKKLYKKFTLPLKVVKNTMFICVALLLKDCLRKACLQRRFPNLKKRFVEKVIFLFLICLSSFPFTILLHSRKSRSYESSFLS